MATTNTQVMNNSTANTTANNNGLGQVIKEVVKGKLNVSRVYTSPYQKKGTITAEVKQTITTKSKYPSARVTTSMQDNPFSIEEFNFGTNDYVNEEVRVVWLDVPPTSTIESVQRVIDNVQGACIYKTLSNKPILTKEEKYAIDNPSLNVTLDMIADRQVLRYGNNAGVNSGKLILDRNTGKPQYRVNNYSNTPKEDIDLRTEDASDFYASPTIQAELDELIGKFMENNNTI